MKLYHINQEKLETAASKLKAISHPVRIAILELLSKEKMCVIDIYEQLGLGQATTLHYLNILRTNGVLISKRHGKKKFYEIKHKALVDILDCINRCQDDN